MNILVCIKQVSETADGRTPAMNRFDEYALEEAIRIKERFLDAGRDGVVDVITLGPEQAAGVVKRAFGMGADNGCHLVTDREGSSAVTAGLIAGAVKGRSYDLVVTGIMSQDRMEGQTGPILAELLGLPCATGVVAASLDPGASCLGVERELEKGERECLSMGLPVLITVQAGINTPRYPTLSRVLRASKKKIHTLGVPGATADTQTMVRLEAPSKSRSGRVLGGTVDDKALALFALLRERGIL
ncbi:MAG: electron transfer flavoprotein subunit beta/FixA family protein [Desulfobacteraceae bacterium]|nr:electron transfer flavoprotein subunit beta/FixA family protein [Desulfobacteraceae bacterium]